ncbi:MAG: E3 ubiquitin ligase family protein [Solirubrobacteraceae bacterium]|nr:E3 ubiquitin ligase family protein [Solirubrobacteraceae bacterium]
MLIAGAVLLVAAIAAWFYARHERKKERRAVATETVTCADASALAKSVADEVGGGNFHQRCEIVGAATAVDGGVEKAPESGVEAVWHRTTVTHKYWEMESSTTDGKTTRRRVEREETVSDETSEVPFAVTDATGSVRVVPSAADIDRPEQVADRFERGESMDSGGILGALLRSGSDSGTVGFQHEEWAIRPGTQLYVQGELSDRDGELTFDEPKDKGSFLVSTRSEEELVAGHRRNARFATIAWVVALVLGIVLLGAGVATAATVPASVPTATLATTTQATVVGAAVGYTAWSEATPAGFALVVSSPEGIVTRPAVPTRKVPFDLDLGVGAAGPVAAYSRCAVEPQRIGGANATAPNYATGRGCRLYTFDLKTGAERKLAKTAGTTSEVLPSVSGNKVAFVAVKANRTASVRVRDTKTRKTVVVDRGVWRAGTASVAGGPASLDTDGTHVAVVWRYEDREFHDFNAVLNVASASGRTKAHQVSYGVNNDECNYDSVLAPTVTGGRVTYLETDGEVWMAERVSASSPGAQTYGPAVFGGAPVVVTSAAQDGNRLVVAQTATTLGHPAGTTTVATFDATAYGIARPPVPFTC